MDSKVRIILLAHSAPQVKPSIERLAGLPFLPQYLPASERRRRARACECYGSYYPPVVELCVAAEPSPPSYAATYLVEPTALASSPSIWHCCTERERFIQIDVDKQRRRRSKRKISPREKSDPKREIVLKMST